MNTLYPAYSLLSDSMSDSLLLYLYRYSYLVKARPGQGNAGTTSAATKN